MNPSYWLIWEELDTSKTYSRKFPTLEGLNDFLLALRVDNLAGYEVLSGFSLRKEVFK